MRQWIALFLVAGLAAAGEAADTPTAPARGATGSFESGEVAIDIHDAYAFRGKSASSDDPVIIVAASDAAFKRSYIDRWFDRKQAIEKRFKDEETAVIYFEFSPKGEFGAISYYLGPGNGCVYCSGGAQSTVKLVGNRLVGSLTAKGKNRTYALELDVPIASDDHGPALPAGGGEPGKVYLAFHEALKAKDAVALRKTLGPFLAEQLGKAEEEKDVDGFFAWLSGERYADTVKVERAFASADSAVLLVSGTGENGARRGQVVLAKEKDGWRVADEVLVGGD